MVYLFILESIGTAELLLIGLVALIVFGPRKLPEFARMLGKARNEFKRTTDDFKQTWEREVNFENLEKADEVKPVSLGVENLIQRTYVSNVNEIAAPEIKEVFQKDVQEISVSNDVGAPQTVEKTASPKQDWL